jgi:hypothetical protein
MTTAYEPPDQADDLAVSAARRLELRRCSGGSFREPIPRSETVHPEGAVGILLRYLATVAAPRSAGGPVVCGAVRRGAD